MFAPAPAPATAKKLRGLDFLTPRNVPSLKPPGFHCPGEGSQSQPRFVFDPLGHGQGEGLFQKGENPDFGWEQPRVRQDKQSLFNEALGRAQGGTFPTGRHPGSLGSTQKPPGCGRGAIGTLPEGKQEPGAGNGSGSLLSLIQSLRGSLPALRAAGCG